MSAESLTIGVFDSSGTKLSDRSLEGTPFNGDVDTSLLHQVVRWQLAGRRAGTHSSKTRSEVAGGGAKPWRQKGTGRARSGSNTSPVWVGGGAAHGPKPRDYSFDLNRKQKKLAVTHAVRARISEQAVLVLEGFGLNEIRTKVAAEVLKNIGCEGSKRVLVIFSERDENAEKSTRNIPNVELCSVASLNVYDILRAKTLVFVGDALDKAIAAQSK